MNAPLRIGLQVVLGLVIIALVAALYYQIVIPGQRVADQERKVDMARQQMDVLRTGLIRYARAEGRYPTTLDSVVIVMRNDSAAMANPDSVYELGGTGYRLDLDNILVSPRTEQRFVYEVNQDTTDVPFYVLEDPGTGDIIGSLTEPTRRNAASWE